MEQFTQAEMKMLLTMLNDLSDVQGNAGCNDLYLPNTKENIDFMEFYNQQVEESEQLRLSDKYITGNDMCLTYYFKKKLKGMIKE